MATTQKKTAAVARKTGTGGKRTASTATGSRSAAPARKKTADTAGRPIRREVGALICLLLGIFAIFGYFNVKALFIDFYVSTLKGLVGFGFWLVPPALFLCAWILGFHRGNPVKTRVISALLLPLSSACVLHGLLAKTLPWNGGFFGTLWAGGQTMKTGGVLGGVLAQIVVTLVSDLGCTIVFGLVTIFLGLTAFNRTIFDVAEWIFSRPHPDYTPQPPRQKVRKPGPAPGGAQPSRMQAPARQKSRSPIRPPARQPARQPVRESQPEPEPVDIPRRKRFYDIPIDTGPDDNPAPDDEELSAESASPEAETPEKESDGQEGRRSFFRRGNRPSPDTYLKTASRKTAPVRSGGAEEEADGDGSAEEEDERFVTDPISVEEPVPIPEDRRIWDDAAAVPELSPDPEEPLFSVPEIPEQEPPFPEPEPPVSFPEVRRKAPAARTGGGARLARRHAPAADPEEEKVTKKDTARAAMEVGQDIRASMDRGTLPYQYPPISLLKEGSGDMGGAAMAELNSNRQRLADAIHSFGIDASIVNVTRGPSVTRYELELDQGVRLNKLTNLADDIALALGASGVRIAPIPDQISMVGIEVPNRTVTPVSIHSVISSPQFAQSRSKVSFAVGKDIGGNPIVGNIARMPHMLIAGTTGSGKSVCTNSLIISLLYKATPDEVRLIMVDPKMVELGIYNGIPHLLIPVVTDPKKAAGALQWAVTEMMKRYRMFSDIGVRDLESYNKVARRTEDMETMPQIVVIIDELADLMLVAAKEVEESICRVAQMGRASGMHLVIATQRPSADVITGLMKANIPSRIAFAVASSLESRIILDQTGAEKLVGRGDMLYFPLGSGKPRRVQGCLITDQEVADVVGFVKENSEAHYDDEVLHEIEVTSTADSKEQKNGKGGSFQDDGDVDELVYAAAELVISSGGGSVSMLQRRLKLGFARAARIMDQLEEMGIVGPADGTRLRQVLVTKEEWQEKKYREGIATQGPGGQLESAVPSSPPPDDSGDGLDLAEEDTL